MLAGPWNNRSATGQGLGPDWEEAQWQELDGALSSIFAANDVSSDKKLCREELYRVVEDVCVEGYAATLYERLARALFSAAEEKTRGIVAKSEGQLATIAEAWRLHAEQVRATRSICLYLDRAYAASTPGVAGIWDVGTAAFRSALKAEPGLESALTSGLCAACKRDRDGEKTEVEAMRDCCRMLAALKIYGEFEEIMLLDAEKDFAAQARWLSSLDTGDRGADASQYARAVLARIEAAHRAVSSYLEPRTLAPFLSLVEEQLVSPLAGRVFRTSFGQLVDSGDLVTLERLCEILGRIGDTDVVRKATREYAVEQALKIFSTTSAAAFSAEDAAGREEVVDELLSLHRRLSTLCSQRLRADDWGPAVLKDAFEEAVNDERYATAFAELLAGYVGSSLGTEKKLDKGMRLFRYSRSKDVFEAFYRRELAARLLEYGESVSFRPGGQGAASLDLERALVRELETECGASYVSKLEGMCKDIDIAQDVAHEYARTGELVLAPKVLTVGYWPAFPETNLVLPAALEKEKAKFEKFYVDKFQGRRLSWQHDLDRCVLRYAPSDKDSRKREFDGTMAQAAVLLSFDKHNHRRLAEISKSTGLEEDDVTRVVMSLATSKVRLLDLDDEDRDVAFDPKISHKSYLVRLPAPRSAQRLIDQERSKVVDNVARDRQYAIDATIVRVMKARQTLPHQQLIAELLARLKYPATPADIKKRIESLLDREYLERDQHDDQLYNYLA